MIRAPVIGRALGRFMLALSLALFVPFLYSLVIGDDGIRPLFLAVSASSGFGLLLVWLSGHPPGDLTVREAFLLVAGVWISISLFGALPFYFSPHFPTFADAIFESSSGFTTTGATILPQVEVLPHSLQLWRHFTHWLGGMGVVLLGLAILPLVGLGGMQLYRAEFSGSRSEKLKPRIRETALALWKIYAVLTVVQMVALRLAGMSMFDAVCHTFSTLGTGGFSTRNASIAAFNSPLIESIIIVFMVLSGVSFAQHYRLWVQGQIRPVVSDVEVRGYFAIMAVASIVVAIALSQDGGMTLGRTVLESVFQVSSIMTTTGFISTNFELWHPLPQVILLALMFVGGSTGSTAGGLKVARILLMASVVNREFKKMVERRGVFAIRMGGRVIEDETIHGLLNLVYLALLVNFVAVLVLAATGIDVFTAFTAVASCMLNVGPELGTVGPAENYSHMPGLVKWILAGVMIAGRLEFYSVLVIATPAFWRK